MDPEDLPCRVLVKKYFTQQVLSLLLCQILVGVPDFEDSVKGATQLTVLGPASHSVSLGHLQLFTDTLVVTDATFS